jgi:hypothetical protein
MKIFLLYPSYLMQNILHAEVWSRFSGTKLRDPICDHSEWSWLQEKAISEWEIVSWKRRDWEIHRKGEAEGRKRYNLSGNAEIVNFSLTLYGRNIQHSPSLRVCFIRAPTSFFSIIYKERRVFFMKTCGILGRDIGAFSRKCCLVSEAVLKSQTGFRWERLFQRRYMSFL